MMNEFIILEQPERSILSIVLVDEVPVSEETHNRLIKLKEVSDIMLIYKSEVTRNIKTGIFGSLYQACGYIEATNDNLSETLMRTFEYDHEIFGGHSLVLITKCSDFTEVDPEKLQIIAASSINKPILKTRKLTSQEFFEIYQKKTKKEPGFIEKWFYIPIPEDTGTNNLYCSMKLESKEIILRPSIIEKFLNFWEIEKDNGFSGKGYVCSFKNINCFIPSFLRRLRFSTLEVNPNDI